MLNELAKQAHENSRNKGFYDEEEQLERVTNEDAVTIEYLMTAKRLALIHGEVSEALEADRNGEHCKRYIEVVLPMKNDEEFKDLYGQFIKGCFEEELSDILIRVFDLAAWKGIDLDAHVAAKMRYNSLREHKHGKKY